MIFLAQAYNLPLFTSRHAQIDASLSPGLFVLASGARKARAGGGWCVLEARW